MKKKALLFCMLGALAFGACTVSAENGTRDISVSFRDIKIITDGSELFTGAEPLIYNGTAYLPIRSVGEAFGKEVGWDSGTNTVTLNSGMVTIETDPTAESTLDFALSVTLSEQEGRREIIRVRETKSDGSNWTPHLYSLYYYGVSDVSVTLGGQTLPLAEALETRKITPNDILKKANRDWEDGIATSDAYRDGGSIDYVYKDYAICKFNSRCFDLYICGLEMKIFRLPDEYSLTYSHSAIREAMEQYSKYADMADNWQEKQRYFEDGVSLMQSLALRDFVTESELEGYVRQFREMCGLDSE